MATHENIATQIASLIQAWSWTENDYILSFLPLHHVHGIVNLLSSALWAGATCEMLPRLRLSGNAYARAVKHWKEAPEAQQKAMTQACEKLRLMISG